jgi:ABC-type nitrate/sulfonate/bicarbonate transport system ATPase subunit
LSGAAAAARVLLRFWPDWNPPTAVTFWQEQRRSNIQDDTRMMFQDARLLPWKTVIDNVGLGLKGTGGMKPAGAGRRWAGKSR